MNWKFLCVDDGTSLINGLSNHIHNSTKGSRTDGDHDGASSVSDLLTSDETFSGVKSDGSNCVTSEMLSNLKNESGRVSISICLHFYLKGIQDLRGNLIFKVHVDDGSNNL